MQGPTIKTYFAKKMGIDPTKIVNVALTPCTAKKFEIRRDEMNAASKYLGIEGMRDMDYVITTRELAMLAKDENIDFANLPEEDFDDFMGKGSGAGVIFGNTGGVMEAAIRSAYALITKKEVPASLYDLEPVRGMEGIRDAVVDIDGLQVKVAVVYGTANARKLIEKIKAGEADYHFVEVMTCPGGCIGGGGQPKDKEYKGDALREKRIEGLYKRDDAMQLRLSHENPQIKALYEEFYGEPLSELAEQMLHTMYFDRSADLGEAYVAPQAEEKLATKQFRCKVCGYIYEGDALPEKYVCPLCKRPASMFEEV
jgi:ferredoxin hydrogenase